MTTARWTALLDRFEADLAESAVPAPWAPPDTALPPELAPRARALLARQEERMRRLQEQRDDIHAQIALLRRLPPMRGDAPVLLDLEL